MTEAMGAARLILAEPDAFVGNTLHHDAYVGASVVMQQRGEKSERLLSRVRRSARELRRAGYQITDVTLVLGVRGAIRMTSRLAVAHGLLDLLSDASCTLHLVASIGGDRQDRLFELAEQLLCDEQRKRQVHLAFLGESVVPRALKALPRTLNSRTRPALDLTG